MAHQAPSNSVWTAMHYQPPRGPCNYKTSLISSCPCLRFMLHPVKAATSFECDGCAHHASFHSLENPTEAAVLAKWSMSTPSTASNTPAANSTSVVQSTGASSIHRTNAGAGIKRKRLAASEAQPVEGERAREVLELTDDDEVTLAEGTWAERGAMAGVNRASRGRRK